MKRVLNVWLLIFVGACGLSLWLGKGAPLPWGHASSAGAGALPTGISDGLVPGLQVLVLNGTSKQGLARDFGLLLGRCGLAPVGYGNAPPQDYDHCFLVNRRLTAGQVSALRNYLGNMLVLQEFDGRTTEDAVLVLGADHAHLRAEIEAKSP